MSALDDQQQADILVFATLMDLARRALRARRSRTRIALARQSRRHRFRRRRPRAARPDEGWSVCPARQTWTLGARRRTQKKPQM